VVGKTLARRVAVLRRGEHRAEVEDKAVRVLVVLADRLAHKILRVAADAAHGAGALQDEPVLALNGQPHFRGAHVVKAEIVVEEADKRADRGAGVVVLGLGKEQRRAAFYVPQVDVIAKRRADDFAGAGDDQHHFRLGVVPGGDRMQAGFRQVADCRHRLCLGEDFGVRADADFQILRPHPALDKQLLERRRLLRAGFERAEIVADRCLDLAADLGGALGLAARLLLDNALQHGHDESHAGGLDGLQVDRGEQPGLLAVAGGAGRVGQHLGKRADRLAVGARMPQAIRILAGVAHGGVLRVMSTRSSPRTATTDGPSSGRVPDAAEQHAARPVIRARVRRHPCISHPEPPPNLVNSHSAGQISGPACGGKRENPVAIFFTGDTHFGDRRVLRFDHRPFGTLDEHDEALVAHWNEAVGPDDEVWHLGDFALGPPRPAFTSCFRA
jgi:hypothetical protein